MNFATQTKREEPRLTLTPLIDIVFLLLIFFMITTSFNERGGLDLRLPTAEATAPLQSHQVKLTITAQGLYMLDDRPQRLSGRAALIEELAMVVQPGAAVTIESDARVGYQAVVTAMDALSQLGINKISLVTVTE